MKPSLDDFELFFLGQMGSRNYHYWHSKDNSEVEMTPAELDPVGRPTEIEIQKEDSPATYETYIQNNFSEIFLDVIGTEERYKGLLENLPSKPKLFYLAGTPTFATRTRKKGLLSGITEYSSQRFPLMFFTKKH